MNPDQIFEIAAEIRRVVLTLESIVTRMLTHRRLLISDELDDK